MLSTFERLPDLDKVRLRAEIVCLALVLEIPPRKPKTTEPNSFHVLPQKTGPSIDPITFGDYACYAKPTRDGRTGLGWNVSSAVASEDHVGARRLAAPVYL
jgi:hypothetical protein